jgi:hypothetical protein
VEVRSGVKLCAEVGELGELINEVHLVRRARDSLALGVVEVLPLREVRVLRSELCLRGLRVR